MGRGRQFALSGVLMILLSLLAMALWAREIITYRTCPIVITRPDGTSMKVGKSESLPEIHSGSMIEILSGTIEVAPSHGFIQLSVGDLEATVEEGEAVLAFFDEERNMASFKTGMGEVPVVVGNTTIIIKAGQEILFRLDKETGLMKIMSVRGVIETDTVGVKADIPEGGLVAISTDAKTGNVHLESGSGKIQVTSAEGEVVTLAMDESVDVAGSPAGVISSFPEDAPLSADVRPE